MPTTKIHENDEEQTIQALSKLHLERTEMWAVWMTKMQAFASKNDDPISVDERGGAPQVREGLDEIFP